MNKELEEAKKVLTELKDNVALFSTGWKSILKQKEQQAIETILNYIDNSIHEEVVKKKIEELNNGIKEDMKNYDKVKDENWKLAIHRSMRQKIKTRKALQELLEGK